MEPEETPQSEQQSTTLTKGWIAFYLIFAIVYGTVVGCLNVYRGLDNLVDHPVLYWLNVLYIIMLALTGILIFVAFRRRATNAVSLARVLHIVSIIDAVMCISVALLRLNIQFLTQSVIQFGMGFVWLIYLSQAKQVKALFPVEKRVWGVTATVLLGVMVSLQVVMMFQIFKMLILAIPSVSPTVY